LRSRVGREDSEGSIEKKKFLRRERIYGGPNSGNAPVNKDVVPSKERGETGKMAWQDRNRGTEPAHLGGPAPVENEEDEGGREIQEYEAGPRKRTGGKKSLKRLEIRKI